MANSFEFIDFSIQVTEAMNDALIAALYEAAGELHARTVRNSRQGHKYGDLSARALWEYLVDEGDMKAQVGSPYEAGYWEEFGTGEHAQNGDGRKGWWVYIEGGSGYEGKTNTYSSKEEAERMARYIKKKQEPIKVKPKLNFVLTTYYKGTGMEEVLKKLEQYVDNADKSENDITCI